MMHAEMGDGRMARAAVRKAPAALCGENDGCDEGARVVMGILSMLRMRHLGWGFLIAWVFCVFYTDAALHAADAVPFLSSEQSARGAFLSAMPVVSAVAALIMLIFAEKRFGDALLSPSMVCAAAFISAVSTPLLFLADGPVRFLYALGSIATGVGSAFLWVAWGVRYAGLSQEELELHAPASALFAALLILMTSAMEGLIGIAFVALMPAVSALCLFIEGRARSISVLEGADAASDGDAPARYRDLAEHPTRVLGLFGRSGLGVLLACLFTCIAGAFWRGSSSDASWLQALVVAAAFLMLVIGGFSVSGPRRVSISYVFRWMCPLLIGAFAALIAFDGPLGAYLANGASLAARFAFCTITQMYFARFAARGLATATQSYGWGWVCVHLGDFLGLLVTLLVAPAIASGAFLLNQFAACCMFALAICTMLVLDDDAGFKTPLSSADSDCSLQPLRFSAEKPDSAAVSAPMPLEGPSSSSQPVLSPAQASASAYAGSSSAASSPSESRIEALSLEFRLTQRESEVFALLMRGRSVPYIRDELTISRDTVATHVKHIYAKAGVHSRQELLDLGI